MWRGFSMYFSMYTRSSPKLPSASDFARAEAFRHPLRRQATRMPLPPPPAVALIITG